MSTKQHRLLIFSKNQPSFIKKNLKLSYYYITIYKTLAFTGEVLTQQHKMWSVPSISMIS